MARSTTSTAARKPAEKVAPKPRPLARKRGERKREKILQAAAMVFAERGYSSTTLNDIAAAAGTHAGSLYYHFASRDDITREVMKYAMTKFNDEVQKGWSELPECAGPAERIRVGMKVNVQSVLSDDPFLPAYNRIINEVPPGIRDEFIQYPRAYAARWRGLVREAQQAGEIRGAIDPSVARMFLLGSVTWSRLWFNPKGHRSVDEIADMLVDIFFNGMLTDKSAAAEPPRPARAGDAAKTADATSHPPSRNKVAAARRSGERKRT